MPIPLGYVASVSIFPRSPSLLHPWAPATAIAAPPRVATASRRAAPRRGATRSAPAAAAANGTAPGDLPRTSEPGGASEDFGSLKSMD